MSPKRILLNLCRYGKNPKSALLALRTLCEYCIIKHSKLIDRNWISEQYGNPNDADSNPLLQYIVTAHSFSQTSASPLFSDQEYRDLHKLSRKTLPVVHYELFGKKSGIVISHIEQERNKGKKTGYYTHEQWSLDKHISSFQKTIASIKQRVSNGEKIRVAFLVFSSSMFPARPLLDKLLTDPLFSAHIVVIPDLRWPDIDPKPAMTRCHSDLKKYYAADVLSMAKPGNDGVWPDITSLHDIVCYATPYDLSDYHYNPRWSIGREFLPIQANYTLSTQNYGLKLFSLFNQAIFWMTFFESDDFLNQFKSCMTTKGTNCPVVGYIKMDPLADKPKNASQRKCLIIAPHHSISGGYNDILSVSNFLRYSEYFKELPDKYPEIDFVFRPHPFLIQALKQEKVWGPTKTDNYFAELLSHNNMRISTDGDYLALFAKSDGIIQDCCSFLVEYFYTGKPQCYMLKSEMEKSKTFLPFGRECLDHCYLSYTSNEIDNFITTVIIDGKDHLRNARNDFRARLMVNYPNASSTALDLIKNKLGLLTVQ